MTEVLCLMSGFAFGTWVHAKSIGLSSEMTGASFIMAGATLIAACILTAVRSF